MKKTTVVILTVTEKASTKSRRLMQVLSRGLETVLAAAELFDISANPLHCK